MKGGRFIILSLALRSLGARRGLVLMAAFAIAVSVALLLTVEKLRNSARESFFGTLYGTDVIVGARSGDVQLLLYSVFRMGDPTQNMSWESYLDIAAHPSVEWTAPLSLGDSHRGFPVLGVSDVYFERYRYRDDRPLVVAEGEPIGDLFETVIGADVATELGYSIGDAVIISHGLGAEGFALHDDLPFRIAGILEKTGTAVDRTLHVSLEAIEAIHVDWRSGGRRPGPATPESVIREMDLTPKAITATLVGLTSDLRILRFQRDVNGYGEEALSAVLPGVALSSLWRIVGAAETALAGVSLLVLVAAVIGVGVMLSASLSARRREMAILRSVGARPVAILALLMAEAAGVALLGVAMGAALHLIGVAALATWLDVNYGVYIATVLPSWTEIGALAGAGLLGALAGLPPAIRAYRMSLTDGVSVRE